MSWILSPTTEATEDAIIAALQVDSVISAAVREIHSFTGTIEQALQEAARRQPALFVLFGGGDIESAGMHRFQLDAEWHVLVVTRSLRSEKARRHTTAGEIGAYELAERVLFALINNQVGLDWPCAGGLQPMGVELLQTARLGSVDRSFVVYDVTFSVKHELAEATPEQELDLIHSTFEAPNGGSEWTGILEGEVEPS